MEKQGAETSNKPSTSRGNRQIVDEYEDVMDLDDGSDLSDQFSGMGADDRPPVNQPAPQRVPQRPSRQRQRPVNEGAGPSGLQRRQRSPTRTDSESSDNSDDPSSSSSEEEEYVPYYADPRREADRLREKRRQSRTLRDQRRERVDNVERHRRERRDRARVIERHERVRVEERRRPRRESERPEQERPEQERPENSPRNQREDRPRPAERPRSGERQPQVIQIMIPYQAPFMPRPPYMLPPRHLARPPPFRFGRAMPPFGLPRFGPRPPPPPPFFRFPPNHFRPRRP